MRIFFFCQTRNLRATVSEIPGQEDKFHSIICAEDSDSKMPGRDENLPSTGPFELDSKMPAGTGNFPSGPHVDYDSEMPAQDGNRCSQIRPDGDLLQAPLGITSQNDFSKGIFSEATLFIDQETRESILEMCSEFSFDTCIEMYTAAPSGMVCYPTLSLAVTIHSITHKSIQNDLYRFIYSFGRFSYNWINFCMSKLNSPSAQTPSITNFSRNQHVDAVAKAKVIQMWNAIMSMSVEQREKIPTAILGDTNEHLPYFLRDAYQRSLHDVIQSAWLSFLVDHPHVKNLPPTVPYSFPKHVWNQDANPTIDHNLFAQISYDAAELLAERMCEPEFLMTNLYLVIHFGWEIWKHPISVHFTEAVKHHIEKALRSSSYFDFIKRTKNCLFCKKVSVWISHIAHDPQRVYYWKAIKLNLKVIMRIMNFVCSNPMILHEWSYVPKDKLSTKKHWDFEQHGKKLGSYMQDCGLYWGLMEYGTKYAHYWMYSSFFRQVDLYHGHGFFRYYNCHDDMNSEDVIHLFLRDFVNSGVPENLPKHPLFNPNIIPSIFPSCRSGIGSCNVPTQSGRPRIIENFPVATIAAPSDDQLYLEHWNAYVLGPFGENNFKFTTPWIQYGTRPVQARNESESIYSYLSHRLRSQGYMGRCRFSTLTWTSSTSSDDGFNNIGQGQQANDATTPGSPSSDSKDSSVQLLQVDSIATQENQAQLYTPIMANDGINSSLTILENIGDNQIQSVFNEKNTRV